MDGSTSSELIVWLTHTFQILQILQCLYSVLSHPKVHSCTEKILFGTQPLWTKNKGEMIVILKKYFSTHFAFRDLVHEDNEKIVAAPSHNSSIPAGPVNHVVIAFQNNP